MICGRFERYYADKGWWPRWCWKESGHADPCHEMLNYVPPFHGLAARLAREEAEATVVAEAVVEPVVVVESGHAVEIATLPSSAKSLAKWVSGNPGWHLAAQQSITHHEAVLMMNDGKLARKGDVKTPERDVLHSWLRGVMASDRTKIAEFTAEWSTVDGKSKFEGAMTWDMFTVQRLPESQAAPFYEWLRALAPAGAPKPRAPKKTSAEVAVEKDEALLTGSDWSME